MDKDLLYQKMKTELENKLRFLADKPEENADSALKALWLMACGIHKSASEALGLPLPDLTEKQVNKLRHLVDQRISGKPLAYITGRQSFMGLELFCDNRALIPRKETEILGKIALELAHKMAMVKDRINIFDICSGSGNLGLTLAYHIPNARVFASDFSQEAVSLAQENLCLLKVKQRVYLRQGDLFSAFETGDYDEKIDLIVCNPPYISSAKVTKMEPEILANEPPMAFDGGMLGTKIIQRLIREAPRFLTNNGWLAFEVGVGQGQFIIQLTEKTNLYDQISSATDDAGNIRVICMHKAANC